jgi:hypothetical protein
MNRLNESRLRKLEEATSGVARNVVIIAYGPGETAADAAERHFARRPEDRGRPRILCINTGVPRSENWRSAALVVDCDRRVNRKC